MQFLLKNSFIFTEKLSHTNSFKSLHFFKAIYFLKKEDLNIFDKYTHGVTLTNSHATYILHNEEIEYTRPTLFNIYIENIQSRRWLKKFFLFGSIFLQFVQIFHLMCFGEY